MAKFKVSAFAFGASGNVPVWESAPVTRFDALQMIARIRRDGLWVGDGWGQPDNRPKPTGPAINIIPQTLELVEVDE